MHVLLKSRRKVSVCVVTYDQENTIGKCLDSILEKKMLISIFEIVVGDDCSSDGTRS